MKIIGLCGGSGSGKGCVCSVFNSFNIPSIDTDKVYHQLTSSSSTCLDALIVEFGEDIISPLGGLDRKKLAERVFFSEDAEKKRVRLNEIAHSFVLDEVRRILTTLEDKNRFCVVDAPLLFESGFNKECDKIICVIAPKDVRIDRICIRDGISSEAALARISSQITDEELISLCDYCIDNSGDMSKLYIQVKNIINSMEKELF